MSLTEEQKDKRWRDLEVTKRWERLMEDIIRMKELGEIEIVTMEHPTITIRTIPNKEEV